MHDKQLAFHKKMAHLRSSFLRGLPERLERGRVLLQGVHSGEGLSAVKELHLLFHSIKGTSASFQLYEINLSAKAAEAMLMIALEHKKLPESAQLELLTQQLENIVNMADATTLAYSTPPCFELPKQAPDASNVANIASESEIYICDDDPILLAQLVSQLACFGYHASAFHTLDDLEQAVRQRLPSALVMDVVFPEGKEAGLERVESLKTYLNGHVPIVFISSRNDFESRMRAVQAGGRAYCHKPIRSTELLDVLDGLTMTHPPEPFHILVVDDEPDTANYHALVLQEAGMLTRIVSDPAHVLEALTGFNADLVLMDMYLPQCSGAELATLLRQTPGYLSLPIVFLSSETNTGRQYQAMKVGVDGFLNKPIQADTLIAEVSMRAERMRTLRSLMIRDSLTGLYNHTTTKHFLDSEIASASRRNSTTCFAMIDLDYFKKVNDTYGHAMGDQVLVALSRLLQQRVRQSDVVGRYGGEEFAVVLTDIDLERAKAILDQLREDFARVKFFANGIEFTCSFSCGVAAFPRLETALEIGEAADKALYQAKREGRNQVVAFQS
ncbi:response regulator receiver modulated diguanylate cyclase [Magnetococcus marinus MC-1]|uniref:diguanylate cyclase n=1 Tax=Magnetococcus marinus (strain ATCC BAA-1437 / JCM 17883 / MC-1) TaxID=156889 RepID=A0L7Q0_MAGMM|nr:diguanylate cyclase [Magnetococcus marinus]ABK43993.1 response regulator receiver modulated diguanylate cyclase [Magnetococcus marinus MC-1]